MFALHWPNYQIWKHENVRVVLEKTYKIYISLLLSTLPSPNHPTAQLHNTYIGMLPSSKLRYNPSSMIDSHTKIIFYAKYNKSINMDI